MKKETRKAEVLRAVAALTAVNGYPPSYRELAAEMGIAHSAVHAYVRSLRTDGLIHERDPNITRAITLTAAGREHADRVGAGA